MNQAIAKQKQLIAQLQDQLEQRGTLAIFPDGVPGPEDMAIALHWAILGLNTLVEMPIAREDISGHLITIGSECEHIFDRETYNLLSEIVLTGLKSSDPETKHYQLTMIARILGSDGHQV